MLDTGATHHFCTVPNTTSPPPIFNNIRPNPSGIYVLLPNNDRITSTHTANLNLPHLPDPTKSVHLFPPLATGSLISVGQLCDHGYTATFTKHCVITHDDGCRFNGITLKWNYDKGECELSIPEYFIKALFRFKHPLPQNLNTHFILINNQNMASPSNMHLPLQIQSSAPLILIKSNISKK